MVCAAALSIISDPHWAVAFAQAITLILALATTIYLGTKRPERHWYSGRAVAESIKTITWRYVCRAEPFQKEDIEAHADFTGKLQAIIKQNKDFAQLLSAHLTAPQITTGMSEIRSEDLDARKSIYLKGRIEDQLNWYSKNAAKNARHSTRFFAILVAVNIIAIIFALLRIKFFDATYWPTDLFVAIAASLLSWIQAKRYTELSTSYALAAVEINLIKESLPRVGSEEAFSIFIGDAENAFSREHTQWVARKDV